MEGKIMNKILFMLTLSIILNIFSLIGQHLEENQINAYQFVGLIFQVICLILLW